MHVTLPSRHSNSSKSLLFYDMILKGVHLHKTDFYSPLSVETWDQIFTKFIKYFYLLLGNSLKQNKRFFHIGSLKCAFVHVCVCMCNES